MDECQIFVCMKVEGVSKSWCPRARAEGDILFRSYKKSDHGFGRYKKSDYCFYVVMDDCQTFVCMKIEGVSKSWCSRGRTEGDILFSAL